MPNRTIWEEGHHPGHLVVRSAAIALVAVALIHVAINAQLGLAFDLTFIAVCVGSAFWVRPRDFFVVGVLPPLLLAGVVLLLVVIDRGAVAQSDDGFLQAMVTGLAHHSLALAFGYALTLGVLALRQVALRNRGSLRRAPAAARHGVPSSAAQPSDQAPATAAPLPAPNQGATRAKTVTTDQATAEAVGDVLTEVTGPAPLVPEQSRAESVAVADQAATVPQQRNLAN